MKNNNEIPQGYKNSALGIIPQEWEVKRLGEVCTHFKSGITITSEHISKIAEYPVYGGNGLRGYSDKYTHEGAYVLIGRQGALCGNINFIDGKNYISEHAIAVQFNGNIQWLKYKLDFWNLNRFSESSAQPGLSVEKLIRYKLTVPTIAEQEKIAEILNLWDSAIETQSALVNALTRRKRALMQQLLTARKRLPNFNEPWRTVTLGKFGSFLKGKGIPKSNIIEKGFPCLTYGDIYTKFENVIENISQYIDDITASESQLVFKGDILFAASGETIEDIGKNVAAIGDTPIYAGGDIVIFRPEVNIDSVTVSYILNSDIVKKQKYKAGQGHSVVHIYTKDIYKMEFQIPTLHEQQAIADVLLTAEEEIKLAIKRLNSFRTQKKALMQQLLTGKKRVKI